MTEKDLILTSFSLLYRKSERLSSIRNRNRSCKLKKVQSHESFFFFYCSFINRERKRVKARRISYASEGDQEAEVTVNKSRK